jgi:hypothetical protein
MEFILYFSRPIFIILFDCFKKPYKSQNFTVLLILQWIFMVNFKEMLEKIEKLRGQNSAGPDCGVQK